MERGVQVLVISIVAEGRMKSPVKIGLKFLPMLVIRLIIWVQVALVHGIGKFLAKILKDFEL